MTDTLIISRAQIDDNDIYLRQRNELISEEYERESDDEVVVSEECAEEMLLMQRMGLPIQFATTKGRKDTHMDEQNSRPKMTNCSKEPKKRRSKYWHQRYRLFSRFDDGIQLDNESWYSVTPERIAQHIARRYSDNYSIIIDAFCGAGGNTIQFARISNYVRVIAIDIDERKIHLAKHNAQIYSVSDRIEFIIGDYMLLAKSGALKADAVFLSPPWGGPSYLKKDKYELNMMTPNGADVFSITKENITSNIGFLLPRNVNTNELIVVAGEGNAVEVEQNILNGKVKTVTAYFGSLINR